MKTDRKVFEPTAGLSREIGFYCSAIETTRAQLREAVSDLTQEELARRALPTAHQIGNLILHIGEAEASWIHSRVAGRELSDEEKSFAHWCDSVETDYAEKNYTARDLIERIDGISRRSREILARFKDEDLDEFIIYDREDVRIENTLRNILRHLADHEAMHKGQILMLKRLMRDNQNL